MDTVSLNSNKYVVLPRAITVEGIRVETPVEQTHVEQFAPVFRTQGVQQQADLKNASTKVFGPWTGGYGRKRIPASLANDTFEYTRFWDSTCETRFGDARTAITAADSTHTGLEVCRAGIPFKGNLVTMWEDATSKSLLSRTYTGSTTTFENGGTIATTWNYAIVGLDLIEYKGSIHALYAVGSTLTTADSTNGVTWTFASRSLTIAGVTNLTNLVTSGEDIDAGLFAVIGGELVCIVWEETAGTVDFYSTTAANPVWASESLSISSGNGPQGVAVYPGTDNKNKLYVFLREGLYEIDTEPAQWTATLTELKVTPDTNNGRRMTVHNGTLVFGLGGSDDEPAAMGQMAISGGTRDFKLNFGLDTEDGVPNDMLGPVRWMTSVNDFLYVSIGGGKTGRNARIICHNGFGWHFMYKNSTANEKIELLVVSADDDSTPRLHFGKRTAATTTDMEFLVHPNGNPSSRVSVNRDGLGILDLPEIDGGMPTTDAAWLRVTADVRGITTGNGNNDTYLDVFHGLNGVARTTTDLGDIVSTDLDLAYASGAGVTGRTDALRVRLNGSTAHEDTFGGNIDFLGIADEVTVTAHADFANIWDSGGTFEAWVKIRSDGGANNGQIINKDEWWVNVSNESAGTVKVVFTLQFDGGFGIWSTTSNEVTLNEWTHIAITYDSDSTANDPIIYIDGSSVTITESTTPSGTRVTDVTSDLLIGNNSAISENTDGLIDDVRLWSDTRTSGEISSNKDSELVGNETGLVSYWKLNDGSGTTVDDLTANSHDGTLVGGVWNTGSTSTAVVNSIEMAYLKNPPDLDGYTFIIDMDATRELRATNKTIEEIRADIDTAHQSTPLVPFSWGESGTAYVKVARTYVNRVIEAGGTFDRSAPNTRGKRGGYCIVRCEEVV